MNPNKFILRINGDIELDLSDAVEFLDKENVKLMYGEQEVPKIKAYNWGMDENYYLLKSLEWIRKAKSEKDGFNKFFALWVGYNVFYNLFHDVKRSRSNLGDRKKAKATIELLSDDEQKILLKEPTVQQFLSYLVNGGFRVVVQGNRQKNCVAEFKRSYDLCQSDNWKNAESIKRAFDDLMDLLYGIRCNLFHGDKSVGDLDQNHLLESAYNVLSNVFSLMLIKYLIKY